MGAVAFHPSQAPLASSGTSLGHVNVSSPLRNHGWSVYRGQAFCGARAGTGRVPGPPCSARAAPADKQRCADRGVCVAVRAAPEKLPVLRGRGNTSSKCRPLGFDISILHKLMTDLCSSYNVFSKTQ